MGTVPGRCTRGRSPGRSRPEGAPESGRGAPTTYAEERDDAAAFLRIRTEASTEFGARIAAGTLRGEPRSDPRSARSVPQGRGTHRGPPAFNRTGTDEVCQGVLDGSTPPGSTRAAVRGRSHADWRPELGVGRPRNAIHSSRDRTTRRACWRRAPCRRESAGAGFRARGRCARRTPPAPRSSWMRVTLAPRTAPQQALQHDPGGRRPRAPERHRRGRGGELQRRGHDREGSHARGQLPSRHLHRRGHHHRPRRPRYGDHRRIPAVAGSDCESRHPHLGVAEQRRNDQHLQRPHHCLPRQRREHRRGGRQRHPPHPGVLARSAAWARHGTHVRHIAGIFLDGPDADAEGAPSRGRSRRDRRSPRGPARPRRSPPAPARAQRSASPLVAWWSVGAGRLRLAG